MLRRLPLLCPRTMLPGQAKLEGVRIIPPDPGSFKLIFLSRIVLRKTAHTFANDAPAVALPLIPR